MRRVVVHRPGGYERLVIEDADDPEPGPGEVVVRTAAIGVNYADCIVRMGLYSSAKRYVGWPITPGFEAAGEVAAVGAGVQGIAPGDEVVAVTRFGAYATHVRVPAAQVRPRPAGWSVEETAGLPTVFLTAWYALCRSAATEAGHTVLVHSAAGGVGGALLQLARIHGARAVGVVGGPHKVETARTLGADVVIDKSREDLWTAARAACPEGYHAVFDANGVATLRQSYRHLRPTGRLVVYGHHSMLPRGRGRPNPLALLWHWLRIPRFEPLRMTESNKSVMAFNLSYLFAERDTFSAAMDQVLRWAAEGAIRPPPVTTYALDDVAAAHRALETARTVGKLVLLP